MLPKFLHYDYPVNKNFFLISKFTLKTIGFYPESEKTIWLQLWAAMNFLGLAYSCIAELQYGLYYANIDSGKAMDAFCPMCCSTTTLFKIGCIWFYRDEFALLIRRVRQLTEAQQSDEKLELKCFYYSMATRMTSLLFYFSTCTTTAFGLRPLIVNLFQYLSGKEVILEAPFKMLLPDVLLRMPYYPLTYIFNIWYGQITAAGFSGTDGIFLGFCLYFTTLLKSLQLDVIDVLQELTDKNKGYGSQQTFKKLSNILRRHSEIAELVQRFSTVVAAFTLVHFVSASVVIGTSVVDLLIFSGFGIVVYVVYTCAVTTQLFVYCFGGTAVIESSIEIGDETYCSNWFIHDVRIQKMVLLLLLRSQRPFVIRVPFFSPSLPAFTSILRFTGSLIALATQFL